MIVNDWSLEEGHFPLRVWLPGKGTAGLHSNQEKRNLFHSGGFMLGYLYQHLMFGEAKVKTNSKRMPTVQCIYYRKTHTNYFFESAIKVLAVIEFLEKPIQELPESDINKMISKGFNEDLLNTLETLENKHTFLEDCVRMGNRHIQKML